MSVELIGKQTTPAKLYMIVNEIGYEHRNLTIQEVDPANPDDPNNPNPIYNIRNLPMEYDMYRLDIGNLELGVERMFRYGFDRNLQGDLDENGTVEPNDLDIFCSYWVNDTYDSNGVYTGNNYDISDENHDGITNFQDFAVLAKDYGKSE